LIEYRVDRKSEDLSVSTISFNVGPSQLSDAVRKDIGDVNESGIMMQSHRGPVIQDLLRRTTSKVKKALSLPDDYTVLFQPSASAAMETIIRNCVEAETFHFVNGAFAQRFADTAERIGHRVGRYETEWDQDFVPGNAVVPGSAELMTLTHAETSTGRMWPASEIQSLRERYPEPLLAVDATSTFGAIQSRWTDADVWLGSVQKCLGLPSGLGFAVVSPRILERAAQLGDKRRVASWQDLLVMKKRHDAGETVETPNIFAIALLEKQAERIDLPRVEADTYAKVQLMQELMGDDRFYVTDPAWRSWTVHNLLTDDPEQWKRVALEAGAVIGAGYGPLKSSCVRIATFPGVSLADTERVLRAIASGVRAPA
jgi:phosphoserine aminotransferase